MTKADDLPGSVPDQITQARDELGETLEQLAEKVDLRRQAKRQFTRAEVMARDTYARLAEQVGAKPRKLLGAMGATVAAGAVAVAVALRLRKGDST